MFSDSHLTLSSFLYFLYFFPRCISIHFCVSAPSPQTVWREGAGRVRGVAEESFWVHKWPNENWLHHHSSPQGKHTHIGNKCFSSLSPLLSFTFLSYFVHHLSTFLMSDQDLLPGWLMKQHSPAKIKPSAFMTPFPWCLRFYHCNQAVLSCALCHVRSLPWSTCQPSCMMLRKYLIPNSSGEHRWKEKKNGQH